MNPTLTQQFESIFGAVTGKRSLVQLEHIAARFALIPYENLTKIIRASEIGDRVDRRRSPDTVLQEYRRWGAGGTCFSLTYCLNALLKAYGYEPSFRMADLGNTRNNHCMVVVRYNDRDYLIDPGYLITIPLPLPSHGAVIHPTRLHPIRIEREQHGRNYYLSTLETSGEKFRYTLHHQICPEDKFINYWIDSFRWTMMNSLLITQAVEDGRLYIHDRYMRTFTPEGKHGGTIKSDFDKRIAGVTGIDIELIRKARLIIAKYKKNLENIG